jgi:hypothetical protein
MSPPGKRWEALKHWLQQADEELLYTPDAAASAGPVAGCPVCAEPPGPDADATAYVQHCMDTGHPLRRGRLRLPPGARIDLRPLTARDP